MGPRAPNALNNVFVVVVLQLEAGEHAVCCGSSAGDGQGLEVQLLLGLLLHGPMHCSGHRSSCWWPWWSPSCKLRRRLGSVA